MGLPYKTKLISDFYGKDYKDLLFEWYVDNQLSAAEISGKIKKDMDLGVSLRFLQSSIKGFGFIRSYSQAFRLAIRKGRKDYTHLAKPIKANDMRKGISLALRYQLLSSREAHCVLCGATAQDDQLVVDHIIPVVRGGTNDISNLRVLCRACNHGKMIYENEK
ncbi:MAG: Diadenosine tetraphosphate [Parcubacteria group bacterium GW2011_GWA2_46_7]|nr:MAG: Diadenosine tetraphosphate [Parcubacteria group bacterium GW2011_GWA1_45_7]KKU10743.1 MAG: Diadenosine tetraphosphate [Parcubacteria group bacterium GW2011_GWF1_45_5]KKU43640.1 MAG: Diadenosine tetraphosphate [Parcubacteria group bacterium GW2011_GWA2_46_7]OHD12213.1 MAG: hypothetical protein A2Z96_03645 [Spirochaetes bacterium GWB1_48_6]